MQELKLDVQVRMEAGTRKIKALRRENFIPAIVYGGRDKAVSIKVNRKEFESILRFHRSTSTIFHLNIMEGEKKLKDYSAMIKEVQHHPVTDSTIHIDFGRISLTQEITVKVPIVARGESIGVKQDGGALDHIIWELEVICLPTKIPQQIEVEVSHLKTHDVILVKELKLPEGVKTRQNPESIVFSVSAPMKEITPEADVAAGPAEPEVTKEKKEEVKTGVAAEKPKAEGKEKPKAESKEKEAK